MCLYQSMLKASKQMPQLPLHQQRVIHRRFLSFRLQGKRSLIPLPQQGEGQGRGAEVSLLRDSMQTTCMHMPSSHRGIAHAAVLVMMSTRRGS